MQIRLAVPADSAALLRVYGQYIDTPITFEYALPSEAEFAARITEISRDYPYLVCQEGDRVLGYAYAHRVWERAAYQWNAELSVYLAPDAVGKGLGKKLYAALEDLLRLQGVLTVYGLVTLPNPPSEGLHEAMGFTRQAVFPAAGFKAGVWKDVVWFRKDLAPRPKGEPEPFLSIRRVPRERLETVLAKHNRGK